MKPKCSKVIVVEGKYDKIRIESLLDATIITTDGFGIFKHEENAPCSDSWRRKRVWWSFPIRTERER